MNKFKVGDRIVVVDPEPSISMWDNYEGSKGAMLKRWLHTTGTVATVEMVYTNKVHGLHYVCIKFSSKYEHEKGWLLYEDGIRLFRKQIVVIQVNQGSKSPKE